ncbi:MAG: FtsX-like permease family protein [Sphingobacteriia bacterium]|nr:FtsX-like permease family protein [Sphingobacteriia bacterium]
MIWTENIREALKAVRNNRIRAILTMLIIAFGIMAIVGVLTAIDSIRGSLEGSFTTLGSNTFKIQNYESSVRISSGGSRRKRPRPMPPISFQEAFQFKELFSSDAPVAVSLSASYTATAQYRNLKTNNNLDLRGVDEAFLLTENYQIQEGRFLTRIDVQQASSVAVIGNEVKLKLFPTSSPIGKSITVDGIRYLVVGLFEARGASFGSGGDETVVIPVTTARKGYGSQTDSYGISVFVKNAPFMPKLIDEAIGKFRIVRKLKPGEKDDFSISKSDTFVNSLLESLIALRVAAIAIAVITLMGASIGLMNIMLVSVTERTREIGIRKALGATRKQILLQFLTEAIVICQLGGLIGIVFGLSIGNVMSILLNSPFVIPWDWMLLGITICFVVGLISGIYPARKASLLDPIESLRYE